MQIYKFCKILCTIDSCSFQTVMDISEFSNNQKLNCIISSEFPQNLKNNPCFLGIDEAGRGPVLGPMVYAACICPMNRKEWLKDQKFDDSKVLKEEQRDELFVKLNSFKEECIGWVIHILSPEYLSKSMLSKSKYNLNAISHDTAIGLIKFVLGHGIKLEHVYVDTVGKEEAYHHKLKQRFPTIDITVESKADATYPIVSAASICAKVCRDKAVRDWNFGQTRDNESVEYGSGYPSDPKTKGWLRQNVDPIFGFPDFVRFSWSTARKILEDEAVIVDWPEDDEEGNNSSNTPSITEFFGSSDNKKTRHKFFVDHSLTNAVSF